MTGSNSTTTSVVTIVSGPPLTQRVPLRWAYQHEGRTFAAVTVKRLTVAEIRDLTAAQRAAEKADPDASLPLPIFVDDDGTLIPQAVMDGMLDDDMVALERVAEDFFPARFRAKTDASPPASGAGTEPTSGA